MSSDINKPLRIRSLADLKKWNSNPTTELPIVLEWFMDYFFQDLLCKHKYSIAKDAYDTMNRFCEICENFNTEQANTRTFGNLKYYSGYSGVWGAEFVKFCKMYKIKSNMGK